MTRAPCRRRIGEALPRAEKFGDLLTGDHKVLNEEVNLETITDTLSWYKILLLNGFSLTRVKRSLHMRRQEVCQNSWSRRTDRKLYITDNSIEFGKACEDFSWNHRSETNGTAERAVRRVKKERPLCHYAQAWMKDGGLVLWLTTAICEMYKTS